MGGRVLDPIERVSEMIFGWLMAMSSAVGRHG